MHSVITEDNMTERRTIRLPVTSPTYQVCVVGEEVAIDIYRYLPREAETFEVRGTSNIDVFMLYNSKAVRKPGKGEKWPLEKGVKVSYYTAQGKEHVSSVMLYVTSVAVSLDVDVNRIGFVSRGMKNKDSWTWGPDGKGAVLLVNCDRDRNSSGPADNEDDEATEREGDVKDMSPMILTAEGPDEVFDDYRLVLEIDPYDSRRLRVYRQGKFQFKQVLGMGKLAYEVQRKNRDELRFYAEGLQFPDADFSGLIKIKLKFQRIRDWANIFTESVAFRVAPWIMTPNTQKPLEVYVCNVDSNEDFVKQLNEFVKKSRTSLNVCVNSENRGDRWIQDEMEFGYTEAPHKRFPVVFDSPRDRGLKEFPHTNVLGPDFGYVTRKIKNQDEVGTLDAFGNLEVSPPVTANGKNYPLGRILYGGSLKNPKLQMHKALREFLRAQQVQSPVQLYSTWLYVSHIDEFMSFVPAADRRTSDWLCMFVFSDVDKDQLTIDEILEDESLQETSDFCQKCIDINREIMKKELGLTEEDIIDIPILYKCDTPKKDADSFFPDMVNMLVLGNNLGIPKPFGPKINGKCCLEEKVRSQLEPLGLTCYFLDDFASYHQYCGEIHCGTNVVRKPFNFKWWQCEP
ncbi:PREDICTED: protein-arginine deiminase type-1-like [Nanorana parkeri]|uniref:protein-arginine deiminase type-1-like n=1 Tax=Nanorana parkeri TaxID=125878 RepID=UPI000854A4E6|nr:PREDICTED: protein-arginine deiminase type-1-like [Nanorana parkeri]